MAYFTSNVVVVSSLLTEDRVVLILEPTEV